MPSFQPAIKWSGSKRSQAARILQLVPSFKTYYEPFVGGASIAYSVAPKKGVCGDICEPLIDLWKLIQENPNALADDYDKNWHRMQDEGYQVFYEIRENFNKTRNPSSLFFLSRTCVNGLIRFNKNGDFNNSLHHTRKGIAPDRIRKILVDWSARLANISFVCADYRDTTAQATNGDFIYLDPPYFNTKGRYYGTSTIDFEEFFDYLKELNAKSVRYALSFDGSRGDKSYNTKLPEDLFKRHLMLPSGNSSFKKVIDGENLQVYESLYLNY
jgi:DNA adenine methylase